MVRISSPLTSKQVDLSARVALVPSLTTESKTVTMGPFECNMQYTSLPEESKDAKAGKDPPTGRGIGASVQDHSCFCVLPMMPVVT